ncbi:uncharacterized protein NEMAJ01_1030 [Nematocida major]|uniref:uncharacterized protein n=1 Tax=Nematocida major TaxID=1912982 RepID=UPI002008B6F7|nr:uncharacterized protein NEMAJ01_1030 [Nematocida major]KAH9386134.1 hypothetical protein NEMAJ01_1030 [Nematocida major]
MLGHSLSMKKVSDSLSNLESSENTIVKLSLDFKNMVHSINTLQSARAKFSSKPCSNHARLLNSLPYDVSKNTAIEISSSIAPEEALLLQSISKTVLEEIIRVNTVTSNVLLIGEGMEDLDPSSLLYEHDIPRAVYSVITAGFVQIASKRMNRWYKELSKIPDACRIEYLKHAHKVLYENQAAAMYTKNTLLFPLQAFSAHFKNGCSALKYSPSRIPVLNEISPGVYALDCALELFIKNKERIGSYYSTEPREDFKLSSQEMELLASLCDSWEIVRKVLEAIHKVVDPQKEYVDIKYLIGERGEFTLGSPSSVKNPLQVSAVHSVDALALGETERSLPVCARKYLQMRVEAHNKMVRAMSQKRNAGAIKRAIKVAGAGVVLFGSFRVRRSARWRPPAESTKKQ